TRVHDIGAIAHQSADFDGLAIVIDRRQAVMRRQRGKLDAAVGKERTGADNERIGPFSRKFTKCAVDLAIVARCEDLDLLPNRGSRRPQFQCDALSCWIGGIYERGITDRSPNQLLEKAEPLRSELSGQERNTGDIAARPVEACDEA